MIVKAVLLFLVGTTLTSGQFWPHVAPYRIALAPTSMSSGCPSGPELAPLICKFMQPNIGLQFKPPLISPSTYIAPLTVEKCDTPQLQMDIELPPPVEEKKPLVIPQPPELPPMTIPKFPVPVIIEEPSAPLQEPWDSANIAVMPVVNFPTTPELPPLEEQEQAQSIVPLAPLPAAPELPAFVMPELPARITEQESPKPTTPFLEDEPAPAPNPAYFEPLAPLPAAPELPAFLMPEFPVRVVEQELPIPAAPCLEDEPLPAPIPAYIEPLASLPAAPQLPAFVMPKIPIHVAESKSPMPAAPYLEDTPIPAPIATFIEPLAPLPAAPELPALVMPEIPAYVVEQKPPMPAAPCLNKEPISAPIPTYVAPLPAAPELSAFEIPDFVVRVAELPMPAAPTPLLPIPNNRQPLPEFNYNMIDYQPISVPHPPELPAFVMPKLPITVVEQDSHILAAPYQQDEPTPAQFEPLAPIPAAPELPAAPLPQLPVRVEIPSAPIIIEQPIPEPYLDEKHVAEVHYNTVEYKPMVVPQPPELPAFVMPELPVRIIEQELPMPAAPETEQPEIPQYIEPLLAPMPAAPELPPASLPEIPVRVELPSAQPEVITAPEPIRIPQAPTLPEIEISELPVKIAIEERAPCEPTFVMPSPFYQKLFPSPITIYNEKAKEMQNLLLSNQPIDSSAFPTPCVYNLVMQHVLPNMMPQNFRPMENIVIQPASFLPCS